jgi:hypothetical protein
MKENATWNAPSEQEEKIIALMSEVKNLKKFKKKDGPYKKDDNPTAARNVRKKDANLSKSLHGSRKNQVRRTSTNPKHGTVKPGGIVRPKYEANAPAHIASTNQAQCEGKAHKFAGKETDKRKADDTGNAERKLKLAKAYETRIEKVSDLEDDRSEKTYSE